MFCWDSTTLAGFRSRLLESKSVVFWIPTAFAQIFAVGNFPAFFCTGLHSIIAFLLPTKVYGGTEKGTWLYCHGTVVLKRGLLVPGAVLEDGPESYAWKPLFTTSTGHVPYRPTHTLCSAQYQPRVCSYQARGSLGGRERKQSPIPNSKGLLPLTAMLLPFMAIKCLHLWARCFRCLHLW